MFKENDGYNDLFATNIRFGYFTPRKICVLKFGGSLASDDLTVFHIAQQAWRLQKKLSLNIVVVHGGGVLIDDALKKQGLAIRRCSKTDERITDRQTLDVCDRVLADRNKEIVRLFNLAAEEYRFFRPHAVGLSGYTNGLVLGEAVDSRRDFSGNVKKANTAVLSHHLEQRTIPIVNPMSLNIDASLDDRRLNMNADDVALAIAEDIRAAGIIYCSSIPGVLSKGNQVIDELTTWQCEALIADGTIKGGMIPKVRAAAQAAEKLKEGSVIVNGGQPCAIMKAVTRSEGGTRFYKGGTGCLPALQ